jgi:hypothetical protein
VHPTRLSGLSLSSTFSAVIGPSPLPVRPWREVKSRRGAPKRGNTESFDCPNHQCPYFGITDARVHAPLGGWHPWPGFADPNVSMPGLPHHVQCSASHPLVPSENPLSAGCHGADGSSLSAGPFRSSACLRLPASDHHHLAVVRRPCMLRHCTSASFAPCSSHTSNWMNCAPGSAAPHRCSGWPSILSRRVFLCSIWVPARKTQRIWSFTLCGNSWLLAASHSSPAMA